MSLEQNIRRAVLKELNGRRGFDDWWENLDSGIKKEIRDELDIIIGNELRKADR